MCLGLSLSGLNLQGQSIIKGNIIDITTQKVLSNVAIKNIHTNKTVSSKANGDFSIEVKSGNLIELSKDSFETLRIRIANEKTPSYYKLVLSKPQKNEVRDIYGHLIGYSRDSIEYYNTYANILNGTKQGENNACGGASLDALSKANRERWAFQIMFAKWENEKYVDFVFNKDLVNKITYLEGEELKQFMLIYRPSYDFCRNATRYDYLNYIKQSFYKFKAGEY